jgi:hypothetical protein
VLRKPSGLLLAEHDLAVDDHVELTRLAWRDLGMMDGSIDLGRETRGPFVVTASDRAVQDADLRHVAHTSE